MNFHRVQLPKTTVYLTGEEIHMMLLQNMDLYKTALLRGKAFKRGERFEKP